MTTIVLGAGAVGVATAWYLSKGGHDVIVVERQPRRRSRRAGAMAASSTQARSSPGRSPACRGRSSKWLGKENAPLLLRYGAIPHMWRWGMEFARNCTPEHFAANARANLDLALHSLRSLQEIGAETGIEYDRATRGVLKIYRSTDSLDGAQRSTRFARRAWAALSSASMPTAAVELEPALDATTSAPWSARSISRATRSAIATSSPRASPLPAPRGVCNSATARRFRPSKLRNGRVIGVMTNKERIAGRHRRGGDGKLHRAVARQGSAFVCRSIRSRASRSPFRAALGTSAPQMPVIDDSKLFGLVPDRRSHADFGFGGNHRLRHDARRCRAPRRSSRTPASRFPR